MTREEKVRLTGGYRVDSACSGSIAPIARLNFTGLCLSDAGNGLRSADFVSSWPSGISVGARSVSNCRGTPDEMEANDGVVGIGNWRVRGPLRWPTSSESRASTLHSGPSSAHLAVLLREVEIGKVSPAPTLTFAGSGAKMGWRRLLQRSVPQRRPGLHDHPRHPGRRCDD